jgi:hypothetical protein
MPLILGTNSIKDTGFDVANSVRFNSGDSAYMHKTPSGDGNRDTFTISMWVKRSKLGDAQFLFGTSASDFTNTFFARFRNEDDMQFGDFGSSSFTWLLQTNRVFRDPSAWMHFVFKIDTTQGTDTNRVKLYINGVQETSFSTSTYPSQNTDQRWNTTSLQAIGRNGAYNADYAGLYMAEVVSIDGQALEPTSFGEFDEDSGIWKPKNVSGLTAGTNGFYLDFEDSSNLGNDAFGGTDLTEVNLAATDQSTDTCTNNFATLNPLDIPTANKPNTFSQGNLEITNSADENRTSFSSIGVQSGKWYFEAKFLSGEMKQFIGISKQETVDRIGASANSYGFAGENARKWNNNSYGSYGSTASTGDIIMVAFDADNGIIWVGKNGTWFESATQSEIENSTTTNAMYSSITIDDFFMMGFSMEDSNIQVNFGSPMYAISSGNTDGNGYGNFEYVVPSGYFSLNTKNLAEYG